jgi:hypothetical protein
MIMEKKSEKEANKISRKTFLRTCGTLLAGGALAGLSKVVIDRNKTVSARNGQSLRIVAAPRFVPSYKAVLSFYAPGLVDSLAYRDGRLFVAAAGEVGIYDAQGRKQQAFAAPGPVRDMAVTAEAVYLLRPAEVEAYSFEGQSLHRWQACSEDANYCALAAAGDQLFATDMNGKNICRYTTEGKFIDFIESPNRFIIPSLTFAATVIGDQLYCCNSGRHQIESYTLDGRYLGAFGAPGAEPGHFCGCCNPVHLASTTTGELLTSEKGMPRISCYTTGGYFRSLLLDAECMGGGHTAYDLAAAGDRLYVAGKNRVTAWQYDSRLAAEAGACATCALGCPLKDANFSV